ncbi:MAG: tRNA pseudouridine38-40 synthase [Myxococcota bacterium]
MRLHVQFDGTNFHGWQLQGELRTVQKVLRQAVEAMVLHRVTLHASSRTDAGVHARGLPVTFRTTSKIPDYGMRRGLNSKLPSDVSVMTVDEQHYDYWVRADTVAKTYTYRVLLGSSRQPLVGRFSWHLGYDSLDLKGMREAAQHIVGEHSFEAFRAQGCQAKTTIRRIYQIDVDEPDSQGVVCIRVIGNAFLRNMVRIIAGTLIRVGLGKEPPSWVEAVVASRDRSHRGMTAPACGLTLTQVHYEGYPRLTVDKFRRKTNEVPCNP